MRIANYPPNFQPAATSQKTRSESASFGSQLDLAARRSIDCLEVHSQKSDPTNIGWGVSSAYCNLMDQYNEWKAQQPSQDLPASQGPTAENIAWLKDHFTGDLSWEERVDMLETMTQMGVISRDQRNDAMGNRLTVLENGVKVECYERGSAAEAEHNRWLAREFSSDLDTYFREDPVSGFKTADDVFAWLDEVLAGED